MRNARTIVLSATCAVAVIAAILHFSREPEPSWGGRPLSHWISLYLPGPGMRLAPTNQQEIANTAVRRIGTNALPLLLKWFQYDRYPRLQRRDSLYRHLPKRLRTQFTTRLFFSDPAEVRGNCAAFALLALGPEAKPAIPDLARMLSTPKRSALSQRAAYILTHIGKEAVPALVAAATNTKSPSRYYVIACFSDFGTNAPLTLPALRDLCSDPDPGIRSAATNALNRIGALTLTNAPSE